MSKIDMAVEFLEGGVKGCLWEIVAVAVCGDCKPDDEACDTCQGTKIISALENQIAEAGLDYMKSVSREWARGSTG